MKNKTIQGTLAVSGVMIAALSLLPVTVFAAEEGKSQSAGEAQATADTPKVNGNGGGGISREKRFPIIESGK